MQEGAFFVGVLSPLTIINYVDGPGQWDQCIMVHKGRSVIRWCAIVHYSCTLFPCFTVAIYIFSRSTFSCCILLILLVFLCCTFFMLHFFHFAIFSCSIFFMLHHFNVFFIFLCINLFMLHFSHVAFISYLH